MPLRFQKQGGNLFFLETIDNNLHKLLLSIYKFLSMAYNLLEGKRGIIFGALNAD